MMSDSRSNLKFEYLHRDDGNYKTFGELILTNITCISIEAATEKIREKLIDREFFYPTSALVPILSGRFILETDWYEFEKLTLTEEESTENIDISEFIRILDISK